MSKESKVMSKEEIEKILAENAQLKEAVAKNQTSSKGSYARHKERLANDPEYAERHRQYQKQQQEKRKQYLIDHPEEAEKQRLKNRARNQAKKKEYEAILAEVQSYRDKYGPIN